MSKIEKAFENNKAFIAYLTTGQRSLDFSLAASLALIEAGVDILEIGVPFSDPVADGPVIQKAMVEALNNNTTIYDALKLINQIRQQSDVPIILFSYYNPILQASEKGFYKQAKEAGVDGMLIVDLSLEEATQHLNNCESCSIDPIFVISPSTPIERMQQINKQGKGFLYYACRKGTTGMRNNLPDDFVEKVQMIKQNTSLPVVVGFGVSSRNDAKQIIRHADGFVVGSLFVDAIDKGVTAKELMQLAQKINPKSEVIS